MVLAVGAVIGGTLWGLYLPKPTVATLDIGGQTVSVTLPTGWSRAPGAAPKFTPVNTIGVTAHDEPTEAYILFTFARAPASRFPLLFAQDLERTRRACVGADYEDQPIRPDLAPAGSGTFMVLVKCRQEARTRLLIFKAMDQGMLTVERSWASSIKEAPDGADLEDWRDWANSITIAAIL
jgi:hypothetical protein